MARTAQVQPEEQGGQLPLQRTWTRRIPARPESYRVRRPLCAGCRERVARYGFQDPDDPMLERPRTLCFECFRIEIDRRQAIEARRAHGWDAVQVQLPLENKLQELSLRRRRAQIAARKAVGE